MANEGSKRIIIVGAGLTGTLLSIYLSKRGFPFEFYERNEDRKLRSEDKGRSINLTLCERGLKALDHAGVGMAVRAICVPARGRYIHKLEGGDAYQSYGNGGEALYSVSRNRLNSVLLDFAREKYGIPIHFGNKCTRLDLGGRLATFEDQRDGSRKEIEYDVIIGADGVNSVVREEMQKLHQFRFSQFFSTHANKELTIPAENARTNGLKAECLHIWPRGEYMLIGFPNPDGSLTCTLHLPMKGEGVSFASIRGPSDLTRLFTESFPDALPLMPDLVKDYFVNPEVPMVTIRCAPWHLDGVAVLIGDAAHAIWPSYGQGANAGFEDCQVLDRCFEKYGQDFGRAFADFESQRRVNTDTIADLSEKHFNELREHVGDPSFLLRKLAELKLNELVPDSYLPLYSRISFTTTPYREAFEMDGRSKSLVDEILARIDAPEQLNQPSVEKWIRQVASLKLGSEKSY